MADELTDTTLATVRAFHEAFNAHDVTGIMALMSDDCVFENTYPPPDGERFVGQVAVRACWQTLFEQSPQAHFAVEELWACGERALLRWNYRWGGDGAQGHVRGVDVFLVRAGKVAEKLSYVKG
jgi:ketosteroid isomerase-like protein